ncbi:hypothetical protein GCM10010329_28830 [Streptomyces spiroverticillatus]|uniref:Uncharacterized protein n=1 Tax=Streptomyces finlayi TaxID=67296 RepID=A0A918WVZ3_9ACTN|nr:hypothetical protein [Streptomyces finlayi]GHA04442.1 hypothetical protein GCM10010329_28830 [Streptomyces spiroverticillatus]GHC88495.1 hypothetical protein GCM10010334_21240 [Streptomyces finlayi]
MAESSIPTPAEVFTPELVATNKLRAALEPSEPPATPEPPAGPADVVQATPDPLAEAQARIAELERAALLRDHGIPAEYGDLASTPEQASKLAALISNQRPELHKTPVENLQSGASATGEPLGGWNTDAASIAAFMR